MLAKFTISGAAIQTASIRDTKFREANLLCTKAGEDDYVPHFQQRRAGSSANLDSNDPQQTKDLSQELFFVIGVALLSTLHSFSAGPVLIAHIILIHVQRLTHDFRTALAALLSILRSIVLLGLIATLSAFSVLHLGLQDYVCIHSRKDATANVQSILTGISILGSRTGRR